MDRSLYLIVSILMLSFSASEAQESSNILQDSLVNLDTLSIRAYQWQGSHRESPGSYGLLMGGDLTPSDNTSLSTVINTIPGLSMQSGTYPTNRIVIRGMGSRTPFNTNRIRSFFNEIPLSGADGISAPEEIDPELLGSIEILKGPGAALYGSGLGGSLHMHTPSVDSNHFGLGVQYGSFNTLRLQSFGSYKSRKFQIWSGLNHLRSQGFRENNHYERSTFLTHAKWTSSTWSLGATMLLMQVDAGIPSSVSATLFNENPRAAAPNWLAVNGYKKYSRGLFGLNWMHQISDSWVSHLLIYGRVTDNYERRPFNNLDDFVTSGGWRQRIQYRRGAWEWMLGSEWFSESYHWNLERNGSLIADNQEWRNQLNLFSLAYWRVTSRILLSAGLGYNRVNYRLRDQNQQSTGDISQRRFPDMWSPRFGFHYSIFSDLSLYGSAGHGFSMPSPEETLLPDGAVNPGIRAEQGVQSEIGLRWKSGKDRIALDLCVYQIDLNDLLVTKRITEDIFTGINAGKTRHSGFELAITMNILQLKTFPGKLHARTSYTQSVNRFLDFEDDGINYSGNMLPGIPARMVQSIWTWSPTASIGIVAHYQFTGMQFINDENTIRYESFQTLNFRINWRSSIRKVYPINWYIGVNNATNTRYASMLVINAISIGNNEPRYYYPALPLNVFAGFRVII